MDDYCNGCIYAEGEKDCRIAPLAYYTLDSNGKCTQKATKDNVKGEITDVDVHTEVGDS